MATSGSFEKVWQSSYWDQPSNIKYYHWTGNWSKNGNTITLSNMQLWMTFTYTSGGTGVTDVVTVTGGSAQTVYYANFSNTYTSPAVSINNTSFTVSSSQTSSTISIQIQGENTGSTTIYYDSTYVAPTTPTISAVVNGTSVTITYGTTSFGNPSTGTITLYGGTSANPTTSIASSNTTGNNTYTHTGLSPNTTYYYRTRATNGQLNSSYASTTATTSSPFYGSINAKSKLIQKFYGSVGGKTKQVIKFYGSVNGKTKRIF